MGDSCQSYLLIPLTGDVFIYNIKDVRQSTSSLQEGSH